MAFSWDQVGVGARGNVSKFIVLPCNREGCQRGHLADAHPEAERPGQTLASCGALGGELAGPADRRGVITPNGSMLELEGRNQLLQNQELQDDARHFQIVDRQGARGIAVREDEGLDVGWEWESPHNGFQVVGAR